MSDTSPYILMWEFIARAGKEREFEKAYGPGGVWVRLFRKGDGYLGTTLYRDTVNPRRFVTVDAWASCEAYDEFRDAQHEEYSRIDAECETLTESETNLGSLAPLV